MIIKPSEICNYEQFVELMKDAGFQAQMKVALEALANIFAADPAAVIGDDERIARYWVRYHEDPGTPKPKISDFLRLQQPE